MGGIFSKSNRPTLPGAYFNFTSNTTESVPTSPNAAVAIPFTHNWGPFQTPVRVSSFAEFQSIFGNNDDTTGYRAVKQAFLGEGLPGRGGAGEVVCYRLGGNSAAKADYGVENTNEDVAVGLTARYEGTRGNDLRVTVQNNANDGGKNDLILLDGTTVLETFTHTDNNIGDLVAAINANSDWVTANQYEADGTPLDFISGAALSGGDDGLSLSCGDWTDSFDALDVEPFAVFAAQNLTSGWIQASLLAWVDDSNAVGKRFFAVVGGSAGETIQDAADRSGDLPSPNIVNVGGITVTDPTLATGGTEYTFGGSELVARVAGILAARGEFQSLTHARFAGLELTSGATLGDLEIAFDEGVVTLARDSHASAPVHIKTGLTTWTQTDADADATRPYLIYRQPKYVRTIHGIEADLTQWAEENIIGLRPINDKTREAIVGQVKRSLSDREALGAIQSGWSVQIDQDPPPSDDDEFIALAISVQFARSLEQVYFTVSVG
jgi:hypothetical protein